MPAHLSRRVSRTLDVLLVSSQSLMLGLMLGADIVSHLDSFTPHLMQLAAPFTAPALHLTLRALCAS